MDEATEATVDAELGKLQKWLNRHLVSLVLVYWHLDEKGNSKDKPLVAACSGFVLSFGDMWFLVSAGHVLKELDALVAWQSTLIADQSIIRAL